MPAIWAAGLVVAMGLLGFVVLLGPAAYAHTAAPATNVTSYSISEVGGFAFKYDSSVELATNANITLTIDNLDSTGHNFTLVKYNSSVIPSNVSIDTFIDKYGYFATVNNNPGQQEVISFRSPGVGWYEFVCSFHFSLGMFGFVAFGEPLPPDLTGGGVTYSEWPIFVISGTIVSLLIIAIVLGFYVGRRKGPMHEMPPERLGYPETAPLPPPPTPHPPG